MVYSRSLDGRIKKGYPFGLHNAYGLVHLRIEVAVCSFDFGFSWFLPRFLLGG